MDGGGGIWWVGEGAFGGWGRGWEQMRSGQRGEWTEG